MKILLLVAAVIAAVNAQGHTHEANYHAVLNMLHHYYLTLDHNSDGCVTVNEELVNFHQDDANGDCKLTFAEFDAARQHIHGPLHPTEEQIHMMYNFYDTRGNTVAADGFYTCDDLPYFFGFLDFNADSCLSEAEFDKAMQSMASVITGHDPATTLAPPTIGK